MPEVKPLIEKYTLRRPEYAGEVVLTYINGVLQTAEDLQHISDFDWIDIQWLPRTPEEIRVMKERLSGVEFNPVHIPAVEQKIAMFCEAYKYYFKSPYKATKTECNNLRNVNVSRELLITYFTIKEWWNKTKSISNYIKNINEITRITNKAADSASGTHAGGGRDVAEGIFQRRKQGR